MACKGVTVAYRPGHQWDSCIYKSKLAMVSAQSLTLHLLHTYGCLTNSESPET